MVDQRGSQVGFGEQAGGRSGGGSGGQSGDQSAVSCVRFVILHYHIFKNAGSTMEDILDHSFGDQFGRLETGVDGGLIANPDLVQFLDARPRLCAFSSHQIRYPLPVAPGYLFFDICFLRDPIDRLRSFYDYFRQRPNPTDPMSDLANGSSLGDFVVGMIRDHSLFIRNNQVNFLACGGDSDEPDEHDLDLAIRRMMATSFLGVVDCFEESVAAGAAALRPAFPALDCVRPAVNVSRGMQGSVADRIAELRDACGPKVFSELLRITELDRRLVDLAREEVLRRRGDANPGSVVRDRAARAVPDSGKAGFFTVATMARRFVSLAPYWRVLAGESGKILFDADYYRALAPAGAPGQSHSFLDFLVKGAFEGRQPHPLFDPAFYLRKYPDVAAARVNPFCHYLKHGYKEGRQPHPLFDPAFYLSRNPDVRLAELNPLLHYVRHGAAEDRKPHPLFEPKYYRANCGQTLSPGQNPLVHFLESGTAAASPHPLFDCKAYLKAYPDVVERGINPLVHYLESERDRDAAAIGAGSLIWMDIHDVQVVVAYLESDPGTAEPGRLALVWQDDRGSTLWVAEPQQLPFLRAVSVDQIRAQLPAG
jgi:hypothetical protein